MNVTDSIEVFMKRLTDVQQDLLHFVAGALVVYPDDVKDVVQNINYSLISHAKEYRVDLPFLPWAISFAKTQIRIYVQKRQREKLVFDDELLDSYEKSAFSTDSTPDAAAEQRKHLATCLGKLSSAQHRLISLHYLQRRTLRQIAKEEQKPESTIHMTVFRARKALADCIQRLCRLDAQGGGTEPPYTAFDELLIQVIDEQNPAQATDLFRELHSRPDGMELFADQMNIHLLLSERAEVKQDRQEALGKVARDSIIPFSCRFFWKPLAVAAGVLLLVGGIWLLTSLDFSIGQPASKTGQPAVVPKEEFHPKAMTLTQTAEPLPGQKPPAHVPSTPQAAEEPHKILNPVIDTPQPLAAEGDKTEVPANDKSAGQEVKEKIMNITSTEQETLTIALNTDHASAEQASASKTNSSARSLLTAAVLTAALPLAASAAAPALPDFVFRGYINSTINIGVKTNSATFYEVQIKSADAPEETYQTLSGSTTLYTANSLHYQIWTYSTNLLKCSHVRLRACNADGNSAWSAPYTLEPRFRASGTVVSSHTDCSKIFDGTVATFPDIPLGNWAGLDFGKQETIFRIRFAPRFIFANRMKNGYFQCANIADFSDSSNLYTIASAPTTEEVTEYTLPSPVTARYFRYVATYDYFNVAEIEFDATEPFTKPSVSVQVADWTNQYARLTWSFPAGAPYTTGTVQRAVSPNGPWTDMTNFEAGVTSYTDMGMSSCVRYFYRVRGIYNVTGLESTGMNSSPVIYMRGHRIERSWDNLGTLNAGISVLQTQGTGGVPSSAGYPYDGDKDTFSDIGENPYIGLDLGQDYIISSCLFYPRSDNYCFNRIKDVTLWGANDANITNALLTPYSVTISNWHFYVSQDFTTNFYRYVFFHDGRADSHWWGNVAEIGLFGCTRTEYTNAMSSLFTAPLSVQATRSSTSGIDVSWSAGNQVMTYNVQRAPANSDEWTDLATGLPVSTLSYNDTSVTIGKVYQYRIVAVNGSDSAISAVVSCLYYLPGSGTGLLGTYIYPFLLSSYDASESVLQSRVDSSINFNWADSDSLIDGTNALTNVRITWTGKLIAPANGIYIFTADVDDGAALRIDGKFVFNQWASGSHILVGTNTMAAGQHDIRLDYVQVAGSKKCVLKWGGIIAPMEVVPSSQLIPATSFTDKIGDWKCRTFNETQVGIHTGNADGSITVSGWSSDVNGSDQSFTFVWQEFKGSFDFQTKITSSAEASAKGMLMVRNQLPTTSGTLIFAPFYLPSVQAWGVKARTNTTDTIKDHVSWRSFTGKTNPSWLRVCRAGKTFTAMGKTSATGEWKVFDTFEDVGDKFGRKIFIGLAVCNPDNNSSSGNTVFTFSDVVLKKYMIGTVIMLM